MIDRYTKAVLTVIATALSALVIQNSLGNANAQSAQCGTSKDPCFVRSLPSYPVYVATDGKLPLYVANIPDLPIDVNIRSTRRPIEVRIER